MTGLHDLERLIIEYDANLAGLTAGSKPVGL
jgi:hypothetical protein